MLPDEHEDVASASSPSEDALQFRGLMVAALNLPLLTLEETSHPVFDFLGATSRNRSLLPTLDGLLQPAKAVW